MSTSFTAPSGPFALLLALLAGGTGGALLRQETPQAQHDVIEVRELRIVDQEGRALLVASTDADGAFLELSNGAGAPVVFLGSNGGHGALDLLSATSQRVVYAGAGPEGDGGVRTENRDGSRAFYLGDDVRGNGRVPESSLPGARVMD